jgi:hypothetical protein
MKRGILFSAFFVTIIVAAGFSNGPSNENETRNLSGFTKVNFGVSGDLYITIGNDFKVVLEGDKSYLDDIITEVSGDKLVIKKENWRQKFNEKVTVYITMPAIEGLGVSGSGSAEIKDPVKADNLDLSVSGSGKLYAADLTVSDLECRISGSGDIIITGKGNVNRAGISVSGSGNYTGDQVKIKTGEISISGSGSCSCNVTESLNAHVSGSGNVSYLGNPKIDARVSGSGRVRSR